MYDREESLGYLINQAARLTHKTMRAQLGPSSPHPAYLPVLLWLLEEDGQTQAELCRRGRIEQPSMAELLKRRERDALIYRERDAGDRRKQQVYLTEKARSLSGMLLTWLEESNRLIRREISDRELAAFLLTLRRMIANMEEADREPEGLNGA